MKVGVGTGVVVGGNAEVVSGMDSDTEKLPVSVMVTSSDIDTVRESVSVMTSVRVAVISSVIVTDELPEMEAEAEISLLMDCEALRVTLNEGLFDSVEVCS